MSFLQFQKSTRKPSFYIKDAARPIYGAKWKAVPRDLWPTPENQNEEFIHRIKVGSGYSRSGPWVFNYAVRRSPCIFISGDMPRFALAETLRDWQTDPPFQRLGDLRIRLTIGKESFWLDEKGTVDVEYHSWGTIHHMDLRPEYPIEVTLTASLAENSGMAVKIAVEGKTRQKALLDLHFGGLDVSTQLRYPEYIRSHSADYPWHYPREVSEEDKISLTADGAKITNSQVAFGIDVAVSPKAAPEIVGPDEYRVLEDAHTPRATEFNKRIPGGLRDERRVRFRYALDKEHTEIDLVSWKTGDAAAPPLDVSGCELYLKNTRGYFEKVLEPFEIQTPDEVLNAAFNTSLINFDYTYQKPGWYEGIHGWNGYFSNNYQMSAAVLIGQLDRAREALTYYGSHPKGPGHPYAPDGTVEETTNFPLDGMTYYILQLHRYWKATGDTETIRRVWPKTRHNFEQLLKERDPNGDLLLSWHMSCNYFLYQSDFVSLPGIGASPCLMGIGMLEWMADLAEVSGDTTAPVAPWRKRAAYMRRETPRRLWLEKEGRFVSAIDLQGLHHKVAYYTDYVFPILYAGMAERYGHRSLKALDRDLWINGHFLRTGSYGPRNDTVHPSAMCESAEAYFTLGRADRGWSLLHGCALGATILTDSPSFPEYCSLTGWGMPNFIFSIPSAMYIRAVIAGLFGFERKSDSLAQTWTPCIPATWENAALRVGDVRFEIKGQAKDRQYTIKFNEPRTLECKLPTFGRKVVNIKDGKGCRVEFRKEGDFVRATLPRAELHEISMKLDGNPRADFAPHGEPPHPALPKKMPPRKLSGVRKPLVLDELFNKSEFIVPYQVTSRSTDAFDFSNDVDAKNRIKVGHMDFVVRPKGKNMLRIELGYMKLDSSAVDFSDVSDSVVFPINEKTVGLEFLAVSESRRCRLTGMEVGQIILRYEGGEEKETPLVFGGNLDCFVHPFATQVVRRYLACDPVLGPLPNVAAFNVTANPRKILREVEIRIFAADAVMALFAMNMLSSTKREKNRAEKMKRKKS